MGAGVVRDPLVGYQAGGAAGLALGLVIGSTGLVLKPTSGLLEFISKAVNGIGMGILAWGDEVVRIPRTRIRSPRHFGMFAIDTTGLPPSRHHPMLNLHHQGVCLVQPNVCKAGLYCTTLPFRTQPGPCSCRNLGMQ